jgi:hypothetical protein
MRFRLRTLLILLAVLPPLIGAFVFLVNVEGERRRAEMERKAREAARYKYFSPPEIIPRGRLRP